MKQKNKKQTNTRGKKRNECRALMSCTQIFILIIGIFAFSYMLTSITNEVSAQTIEDYACCEKTNSGNSCQFVPKDNCDSDFRVSPNNCEESDFCRTGCCVNSIGACMQSSPEFNCEGEWFDDSSCNIKECDRGCCILGNQGKFTTESNCKVESGFLGLPMDFRSDVNSEVECIFLTETDDEGACLFYNDDELIPETTCVYTTRQECITRSGNENNFYEYDFCSDEFLNTTCTPQNYTGCVEGKNEVYWFDSCGNMEDVKEPCSVFEGSICGRYREGIDDEEPDVGDYVCRNLDCEVELYGERVTKKNGESWCAYEGCIGNGKDTVGSRHIRHICYFGEERIEACGDYRNQICVQSDTDLADGNVFSEASCRVNRWRSCYEYNRDGQNMGSKCEDNPDCHVQSVIIDDDFNFNVCVPNYPPGFDIKSDEPARNGQMECSFASQKCTVVYVKRVTGWECESNCHCEDPQFTQQMNDLCISLGDCGGYVNFNGDYTDDGYTVSRAGRISGYQYESCAEEQPNQAYAEPGDFGFAQILGIPDTLGEGDVPKADSWRSWMGSGMSAINLLKKYNGALPLTSEVIKGASFAPIESIIKSGTIIDGTIWTDGTTLFPLADGSNKVFIYRNSVDGISHGKTEIFKGDLTVKQVDGKSVISIGEKNILTTDKPVMAGSSGAEGDVGIVGKNIELEKKSLLPEWTGDAIASIGAVISIQNLLSAGFGMDEEAAWGIAGGGVLGSIIIASWGSTLAQGLSVASKFLGPIGLAISIYMLVAKIGDTKTKIVSFNCYPWQPPTSREGQDCDRCNTDNPLDVPCSEYRCNSLGQTCEFINARTTSEKCIENNPLDVSSPRIIPLPDAIGEGFDYKRISDSGFEIKTDDDNCIPEYSVLDFGIKTNQPSQCKIGTNVLDTYEQMFDYFGGNNLYIENHTMMIPIIGPNAFKFQYNLSESEIEDLGEMNYYVKCKSVNGVVNTIPHTIKTCVEPGPDLTPPRVTKTEPDGFAYVAYGENEKNIQVWVNEPSSCKYSYEDKDYELMENSFNCLTDVTDYSLYGWGCGTTLTGIEGNNSKIYVKCKDQPWETDNSLRRTMSESYVYDLSVSTTELSIEDIRPVNGYEFITGIEPISFELKAKTTGGAENGNANCEWEGNGYSDYFTETGSDYHSYSISSGTKGNYNIKVICEDIAGNKAENSTSFKITVDKTSPKINRIFYDGGLRIDTDELAECKYGFDDRKFDWDNATSMGYGLEHSAEWKLRTYYVQCEDEYGNKGNKIMIQAYDLIS